MRFRSDIQSELLRKLGLSTRDALLKGAELYPDLFRRFYPKVYKGVDAYPPTRLISALLMEIGLTVNQIDAPMDAMPNAYAVAYRPICDMLAHQVPMYFVTRELVVAALKTDRKDKIDFVDMHLPFESGIFVLPHNSLVHPEHGDCSWIGWGRSQANQEYFIPGLGIERPVFGYNTALTFFTVAYQDDKMPWLHFNLVDEKSREFIIPDLVPTSPHFPSVTPLDIPPVQSDDDFINRMVKLAFNLFLIKETRPKLLRHGSLINRVVRKDRTTEFWSPHILGHEYKLKRQVLQGIGTIERSASRSYWVNGHDKLQAYGPKNSLRKPIWIDPYWVDGGNV